VDSRRAYAGEFRLAGDEDQEDVALPAWEGAKDPAKTLALLETFLAQHPGLEEHVLEAYRDRLDALVHGKKGEAAAAAGLFLLRLDPECGATPEARLVPGFDVNALSKRDQDALLARPLGVAELAVLLDSRASTVRREAAARLRAEGGLPGAARTVLAAAREHPEGALELLEDPSTLESLPAPDPELDPLFAVAALDLLEHPPREPHRRRTLALLDPGSPLGRRLAAAPFPDDRRSALVSRLVRWESSDRFRFPLLDFFRKVGLESVAASVEGARAREAAVLSDRVEAAAATESYDGATLLTRPTLHRLESERLRLGMELKTTIPQAIQKARELGDLRENAEYEAAKAKQATTAKRFEELDRLIHAARLIEDLKREDGVGAPGTEVDLVASDGRRLTVWILGEGDQGVGPGVVSYLAPVGKALVGRSAGDEVELPGDGGSTRYRVDGVRERLP
jgi:transcription elongation factor GreA